jgi:hypothetical protein
MFRLLGFIPHKPVKGPRYFADFSFVSDQIISLGRCLRQRSRAT